jgi:AcrR family transcriptional regulator
VLESVCNLLGFQECNAANMLLSEEISVPRKASTRADQILGVATDLFFEKGYGHVGVDEIGVAAGLSGPAIYRHFKGKGEILAALFDQAIDGLLSVVGTATDNPHLDLVLRVRAHAGYVLTQSKLASVWIREGRSLSRDHRNRLRRRERNYIDQWIKLIGRCYPDLSPADCEVAALTALGTLNSLPTWPRQASTEQLENAFTEFVVSGLDRLGRGDWADSAVAV